MNDIPELPTGSDTPRPVTPAEGSLREVHASDGHSRVEVWTDGEWKPFFDTRSWLKQPAVGQVMRLDTPDGWRIEMFDGEGWVFVGAATLQDGRAKLIGSFPEKSDIVLAAVANATIVEHGGPPWGDHYTFDMTGLTNFLDHIMDDHRYPALPESPEARHG